jgi:hypothetical protein
MRDFTGCTKEFVRLTERYGEDFDAIGDNPDEDLDEEDRRELEEARAAQRDDPNPEIDAVLFGYYLYGSSGKGSAELNMEWYKLSTDRPFLTLNNADQWAVLAQNPDLVQLLASSGDKALRPEDFCKMLEECGFKDRSDDDDQES